MCRTDWLRSAPTVVLICVLLPASVRADLDPNESQTYPRQGYAMIICGRFGYGDPYDDLARGMLRSVYLVFTEVLAFDPNRVWVLVEDGQDDWTQGLFDALPADQATVAETFRTVGERMWSDSSTPRNVFLVLAGHGTRSDDDPPTRTLLRLADTNIYDDAFVAECFNQINNNQHGASPIERLDIVTTVCYGGGLIDDLRGNFHALRGSGWPNAEHFSMLSSGDCYDLTSAGFALQLITDLAGDPNDVPDLNGDGVRSIYEIYDHSARLSLMNPEEPYTPWVPETIYVPGERFLLTTWREHSLYYEWNAPTQFYSLIIACPPSQGRVECDPAPSDPKAPQYSPGTTVTLTAVPIEGKLFKHWELYDPNYPSDDNHAVTDTNNPITVLMDADRQVAVTFQCATDAAPFLPLALCAAGLVILARRKP